MTFNGICDVCVDPEMICLTHLDYVDPFDIFPYSDDETEVDSGSLSPNIEDGINNDGSLASSEYDQIIMMLCDMILTLENGMEQIKQLNNNSFIVEMFSDIFTMIDFEIVMMRTIVDKKRTISADNLKKRLDDIESAMCYVS